MILNAQSMMRSVYANVNRYVGLEIQQQYDVFFW